MSQEFRFRLDGESVFFEDLTKASGRTRRVAGIISTETRDRQSEIVIQKGLNFGPFLEHGWLNDNHSKDTDGAIGWPESVKLFSKGQKLPNGDLAKANCSWLEGYLMEGNGDTRADKIWALSKAIQKSNSPRALGYSLQGSVTKRMGPGRKIVAEATVTDCAVTNCPVNSETKLETLAKSLTMIAAMPDALDHLEQIEKALTAGHAPGGQIGLGSLQGEGAGSILMPESLETDENIEKRKRKAKKLSKAEAFAFVQTRLPNFRKDQIDRLVDAAISLDARGAV